EENALWHDGVLHLQRQTADHHCKERTLQGLRVARIADQQCHPQHGRDMVDLALCRMRAIDRHQHDIENRGRACGDAGSGTDGLLYPG
ncbi:MAG: hypothetical protein V7713_14960, partial [Marinobacter sp.]